MHGPFCFVDVPCSIEARGEERSSSLCNELEAWAVVSLVRSTRKHQKQQGLPGDALLSIGCISPYKLQVMYWTGAHRALRMCC